MNRVVVTGMGVVSPVGNNINEFWENLKNGVCGIDYIDRFDTSDLKVKIAGLVKNFEPTEFIPKSELRRLDLYSQYALCAAGQAMLDSGIEGKVDSKRIGVYFGSGIGGMGTFITEAEKLFTRGASRISPLFIPMMISNIAAGNIAIKYQAKGPSLAVVTACATSTNSIGEAFRAIKFGYADAMIAGGSEATVNPLAIGGFANCMALSTTEDPKQASIPFDNRRNGFVLGEGAGALILEEYEHAKARGAKIYAELVGYGNTCDAHHITSPDPTAEMPAMAIANALSEAEINPLQTTSVYINAHGTSTKPNDKTETAAIKQVFGDKAYDILVSSTKSMTGHMLGAAGAVEAIACIKAINDQIAPPTIGYKEKDEECDLDYVPNTARNADIDVALSTSLGFGGHNACIVFKKL